MMKYFFVLGVVLLLSGCSIGANQTYCERHGADYSEAGVCDGMLQILQNPEATIQKAYHGGGKCGIQ